MVPAGRVKVVVLVVHGLNLDPSRMDELSHILLDRGAAVLRVTLTGHSSESATPLTHVTRGTWRDAIDRAAAAAAKYRAPLGFVGFSLGSLAALDALSQYSRPVFDSMVHLAPAIAPRRITSLARLLPPRLMLPSRTPAAFRVHDRLPASVYHTVLRTARSLDLSAFGDVPTLVYIDPDDELVSLRGLYRLIDDHGLSDWEVRQVEAGHTGLPHHLLVTERAFPSGEFRRVANDIGEFLMAASADSRGVLD